MSTSPHSIFPDSRAARAARIRCDRKLHDPSRMMCSDRRIFHRPRIHSHPYTRHHLKELDDDFERAQAAANPRAAVQPFACHFSMRPGINFAVSGLPSPALNEQDTRWTHQGYDSHRTRRSSRKVPTTSSCKKPDRSPTRRWRGCERSRKTSPRHSRLDRSKPSNGSANGRCPIGVTAFGGQEARCKSKPGP
jgi:hypothetical protein